jgi:uncharacterized protein (TIGR04255 family)
MSGKYKHPPIEEAICQFTLAQRSPWDLETPRRLFEKLRDNYPAMPTQQQVLQANLASPPDSEASGLSLIPTDRVVFTDVENQARLSVGPQTIGIHRARPYIGFEEDVLPRIIQGVPDVLESLHVDPSFINVSVRYINKIEIAAAEFDLKDYFNYLNTTEALPPSFEGTVTGFFYRTAATHSSSPLNLTLNFGSVVAPKDTAAFVLDIDLMYNFEAPVDTSRAVAKIVEVKATENSIFESLITDNTRELFK